VEQGVEAMATDDNNLTHRLSHEIRESHSATDKKFDTIGAKLERLTVEVIGVKGQLRT
jgi:hypothetical protein